MKNIIKFAGAVVVAVALTQTIQAVPLVGNIGFGGGTEGGGIVFDTSSAATATEVVTWITPSVDLVSGDFKTGPFAVAPGTAATFSSSDWLFNTPTGLNPFWQVGGFTFQLLSSFILSQGGTAGSSGYVVVDGTGIVSGNGYTPTMMSWSFSSQDPAAGSNPTSWTFSASADSVPDGGPTVMLLGIALSGVALLRKKLTA